MQFSRVLESYKSQPFFCMLYNVVFFFSIYFAQLWLDVFIDLVWVNGQSHSCNRAVNSLFHPLSGSSTWVGGVQAMHCSMRFLPWEWLILTLSHLTSRWGPLWAYTWLCAPLVNVWQCLKNIVWTKSVFFLIIVQNISNRLPMLVSSCSLNAWGDSSLQSKVWDMGRSAAIMLWMFALIHKQEIYVNNDADFLSFFVVVMFNVL